MRTGEGIVDKLDADALGRLVREVWVEWAREQPNPKPSWLVPYDELSEPDKEVDQLIGVTVAYRVMEHLSKGVLRQAQDAAMEGVLQYIQRRYERRQAP